MTKTYPETIINTSIDYIDKGYILADRHGKVVRINAVAVDMLGLNRSQLTLKNITAKLPSKIHFLDHVKYCGIDRESCSFRQLVVGGRYIRLFLSPVFEDFELAGSLIILEDVTAKVDNERRREQFLNTLVHEFRTPLSAIEGNSSLLQEDFAEAITDKTVQDIVGFIRSGSENVLYMVNQFLEMARLEDGRITFDLQKFDMLATLKSVAEELGVLASEKNISLQIDFGNNKKIQVVADPHRTRQVLTNLIGNALKFTEKGSVKVGIKQNTADSRLHIYITDTGPGISKKDQAGLFQKYFQASSNRLRKDSSKSTGLGLYTTRLLVEGMGGTVYVADSKLGKGSTFAFTVDLATPARLSRLKIQKTEAKQGVEHTMVSDEHDLIPLSG